MLSNIAGLSELNSGFEGGRSTLSKSIFKFGSVLGEGTFSEVHKAKSKKSGIEYAIKVLEKSYVAQMEMEDQMKVEIELLCKLNHPGIIRLFGAYEDKKTVSLVTEFADGGSLFDRLKKHGKLSEAKTALAMFEICEVVRVLHDQSPKIIHRDIKPENILISNGKHKLADFGWAAEKKTNRSTYCGTLEYIAPEIFDGRAYGESVDVWCLGNLMYELMSGLPAFRATDNSLNDHGVKKQVQTNVKEGKLLFDNSFSEDAQVFIRACLTKDPNHRPSVSQLMGSEFFRRHGLIPSGQNVQLSLLSPSSSKEVIEKMKSEISSLAASVKSKDEEIASQKHEISALRSIVDRLEQELKVSKETKGRLERIAQEGRQAGSKIAEFHRESFGLPKQSSPSQEADFKEINKNLDEIFASFKQIRRMNVQISSAGASRSNGRQEVPASYSPTPVQAQMVQGRPVALSPAPIVMPGRIGVFSMTPPPRR